MDSNVTAGLGDSGLSISDGDLMLEPPGPIILGQDGVDSKMGPKEETKQSNAPKRFKSSFIFFSMAKHKAIKEQLAKEGENGKTPNITKLVSEAWRNMSPVERAKYDQMAREDKARYELEKASYTAPPGTASKKKRDPNAPKRPMSAFLAFANRRRGAVKAQNPDCTNGEISKILSTMWKEAADSVKQKYRDDELALWASYKAGMVEWRRKHDGRKKSSRAIQSAQGAGKAKRKRPSKESGDQPPLIGNTFEDNQLSSFFMPNSMENHNQEEMLAASALRGVRGGPNFVGDGMGGSGIPDAVIIQQQNQQQTHPVSAGDYNSVFGVNPMNTYVPINGNPSNNLSPPCGFQEDNRNMLENSFSFQPHGGNQSGNSPAMLMGQTLRGGNGQYQNQMLGFSDQQPPLSQLASLAGSQNMGDMTPLGAQQTFGNTGVGGFMNDNSTGSISRVGLGDHGISNGLQGGGRF